jgi:hypothetical protein
MPFSREGKTMKLKFVQFASLGIVLSLSALPARAEWLHYLVRTSGLAWSDGYHAKDQCPPRQHHFPIRLPGASPGYSASYEQHPPYYFEETLPSTTGQPDGSPTESPAMQSPQAPLNPRAPHPQAHYKPRNRYFEALEAESRGGLPQQPVQMEARRPAFSPPY